MRDLKPLNGNRMKGYRADMYAHMIQQATAFFHSREGRYGTTLTILLPLRVLLFTHETLGCHLTFLRRFSRIIRQQRSFMAKRDDAAHGNGDVAEPRHRGIFYKGFQE